MITVYPPGSKVTVDGKREMLVEQVSIRRGMQVTYSCAYWDRETPKTEWIHHDRITSCNQQTTEVAVEQSSPYPDPRKARSQDAIETADQAAVGPSKLET